MPGEGVYAFAKVHWAILIAPVIAAAFCSAMARVWLFWVFPDGWGSMLGMVQVFPLVLLVRPLVLLLTTECALTTERVIWKSGFLARATDEMPIGKVETVSLSQGIVGRVFGFGDVHVRGTGGHGMRMIGIGKPMEFRSMLQQVCMPVRG